MPRTTKLNKPDAMRGMPPAPADLPPGGGALWDQTLLCKPAVEWLTGDRAVLRLYVVALLDVERLDAEISRTGDVVPSRGGMVVNPLVRVRAMRERAAFQAAGKLRLLPASRYTAKDVGRLARHAGKATATADTIAASGALLAGYQGPKQ